ncbi:MAG: histidine kinase [Deinococcota bacterium]
MFPICLQIHRYFFIASPSERYQSKWIVIGIFAVLIGAFFDYGWRSKGIKELFFPLDADGIRRPIWFEVYGRNILRCLGYSIFPFTLLHALSENNFWRTDPLVRRSITYSSLTLITLLIYGSIVAVLNVIFEQRLSFFVSLIAASVIAVLFHPLKQWLQQQINQRLYGQRDDPYKVLTGLSEHITSQQDALATLQEITESTANVLKLPFVGIDLDAARQNPITSFGIIDRADIISLPLTHELEHLGTLRLARRAEGETFTANEKMLLTTIAQQVSVIAHNYKLSQALQASREQLVIGREEERRRIRRDLHDGLGPTLASTALQLETVQDLIYSKPDESVTVLKTIEEKMTATLAEVRSLVHDLYPTAIDQLGLQEALRTELSSFEHDDLSIGFNVTGNLENLPAATEVASYRIIMEAVHNIVKHAKASQAEIRMKSQSMNLHIHICDDGVGLAAPTADGLGLQSIRERAEELGGSVEFVDGQRGGTCVLVSLPARAGG